MAQDIYKRNFILFGVFAFLLLTILAFTSSMRIRAELGRQQWKKLHQLVYVINVLVAFHFIFAATHENGEPFVYAALVGGLLLYRFKRGAVVTT